MAMLEKCPQCQQPHPPGQLSCPPEPTEIELVEIEEEAFSSVGAPAPAPPTDLLLGQLLDNRYRIERVLGAGGMGKVYAAVHLVTGKRFAIKMLHQQLTNDDEARRRFEREAKVVSTIDHPHIVDLYDYGQTPTRVPFLVMEYMEGATLRSFLGTLSGTAMPVSQAVLFALQMAQALQHVHERGVVHRDVKPDNIQLEVDSLQNMVAKLFDFGIARIQSQEAVTQAAACPPRTLAYAAPEMYERADYLSPAIDVYALGVTLFEILTNQRPFSGSGVELLLAHLKDAPPRASELRQDGKIPAALDALITRMLAKAPEQRPTMAEVADSLAAVLTQLPAASARGLHHLRTYVLPKRLPRHPSVLSAMPHCAASSAAPSANDARSLTQIETARQQVGAKLERESRSIIKRIFRQGVPAEIAELLRCCSELEAARSEVELDLALLQDARAQEKAAIRADRQALRQRLHSVRDELRSVTTAILGMEHRGIAKQLADLELAYSAPVPPSPLTERLVQQESQRHRLTVELCDIQRDLADQLLHAANAIVEESRKTASGRIDPSLSMYVKRLTVVLADLDALDESLVLHLMPGE
jgi:serine/threonine protein kinase